MEEALEKGACTSGDHSQGFESRPPLPFALIAWNIEPFLAIPMEQQIIINVSGTLPLVRRPMGPTPEKEDPGIRIVSSQQPHGAQVTVPSCDLPKPQGKN